MFAMVFDTETDDLIRTLAAKLDRQPQILSLDFSVVNLSDGVITSSEAFLFKPTRTIPEDMTKIHGISDETVKDAPSFKERCYLLRDLFQTSPCIIAHNAKFDVDMVNIEMQRCDLEVSWPRIICTVEQTIWLEGFRQSLTNLHKLLFGMEFVGAHSSEGDVAALTKCSVELFKRGWL